MGKWCQVQCRCINRRPVPGADLINYSDYVRYIEKPRFATTSIEWETNVRNVFECGHRSGNVIEFWPGDIFSLGYVIELSFRHSETEFVIFRRVSDFRNYVEETLFLTPDDAQRWKSEVTQIQQFRNDELFLGWHERETFERELKSIEFVYGGVDDVLLKVEMLCSASINTDNPIELLL